MEPFPIDLSSKSKSHLILKQHVLSASMSYKLSCFSDFRMRNQRKTENQHRVPKTQLLWPGDWGPLNGPQMCVMGSFW